MGAPYLRTYDMRLHRSLLPAERDCDSFQRIVKDTAGPGREVVRFATVQINGRCEVEMQVRCRSCGKDAIYRFRRAIELKFPNVIFVQFDRQRKARGKSRRKSRR